MHYFEPYKYLGKPQHRLQFKVQGRVLAYSLVIELSLYELAALLTYRVFAFADDLKLVAGVKERLKRNKTDL